MSIQATWSCRIFLARWFTDQRFKDKDGGVRPGENQNMPDVGNIQQPHGWKRKLRAVAAPTRGVQCMWQGPHGYLAAIAPQDPA